MINANLSLAIDSAKGDLESFYLFLRGCFDALKKSHLDEPDVVQLKRLMEVVTEKRPLMTERMLYDFTWLRSKIEKFDKKSPLLRLLPKKTPVIRIAVFPNILEADLHSRTKRAKVAALLIHFQAYPNKRLSEFDDLLNLERSHIAFGTHGQNAIEISFLFQLRATLVVLLVWCAYWLSVVDIEVEWLMASSFFQDIVWGKISAFFIWFVGVIAITGFGLGRLENLRQEQQLAKISRWLKIYLRYSTNSGSK